MSDSPSVLEPELRYYLARDLVRCAELAKLRPEVAATIRRLAEPGAALVIFSARPETTHGVPLRDCDAAEPARLAALAAAQKELAAIDGELARHGIRLDGDSYGR